MKIAGQLLLDTGMMDLNSQSVTLYPKKASTLGVLCRCIVFTAVGISLARWHDGWQGYYWAIFCGLAVCGSVLQLFPGRTYLRVERNGFAISHFSRPDFVPWEVVSHFFVAKGTHGLETVGFNYVPSYDRARLGRKFARMIVKFEGGLPSTFGKTAEELVNFLNACLQAFHETKDKLPPGSAPNGESSQASA